MQQLDRLRSVRAIPSETHATHAAVVATQSQLAELRSTIEASANAQLEAIRFLTRSVEELSARLARLERTGEDPTA